MVKINLSDIVTLPAFEEAGDLFHQATGMIISFYDINGKIVFYPPDARCELCKLIQSTPEGMRRCIISDAQGAEKVKRGRKPVSYECHAGLTDVVVPVVFGNERIGNFFSGQALIVQPDAEMSKHIQLKVSGLDLDPEQVDRAFSKVPVMDSNKLELAMNLLSVICNHLVESEMTLRQERELTREQRKLRRAAEEKAKLERDLREMELRLVHAQLNPHFLFNALNLILGQAMAERAPQTSYLVGELAVLLRNGLTSIGKTVTLADEAASARAYVDIFSARFAKQLDFSIDLPESLMRLQVPALILQPLVENALVHALPRADGPFKVHVSAVNKGEVVQLSVSDNGPPIDERSYASLISSLKHATPHSKTTGLNGLNRRLKYYYPNLPDIHLHRSQSGLTITITLPLLSSND